MEEVRASLVECSRVFRDKGKHNVSLYFLEKYLEIFGLTLECILNSIKKGEFSETIKPKIISECTVDPGRTVNEFLDALYNFTVFGYYLDRKDDAVLISDFIIYSHCNAGLRSSISNNLFFYIKPLNIKKVNILKIDLPLTQFPRGDGVTGASPENPSEPEKYNPLNPSIMKNDFGGYIAICRTVNFHQVGAAKYTSMDTDGIIRTRNYLVTLDNNFDTVSQLEIVDNLQRTRHLGHVQGMEDCRLFGIYGAEKSEEGEGMEYVDRELWFTHTTLDVLPFHLPQIALCKLPVSTKPLRVAKVKDSKSGLPEEPERLTGSIEIESFEHLPGPVPGACEKNWLPFEYNGNIALLYHSDPTCILRLQREGEQRPGTFGPLEKLASPPAVIMNPKLSVGERILRVQPDQRKIDIITKHEEQGRFSAFRGSASPLAYTWNGTKGYLLVIHEVIFRDNRRYYYHRFVWMDGTFKIKAVSYLFYMMGNGVEYCISSTWSHSGTEIILGVGFEDRAALILEISTETIDNMLLSCDYL